MPISINGTTGISGVDGSAGTPALQGTDTNTGIAFGSDVIIGSTGGSERFRCDSSGRMLVGTSSTAIACRQVLEGSSGTQAGIQLLAANTSSPADGSGLGAVYFADNTHASGAGISAVIIARRDGGTWSASSKPTRLEFSTTADSASSPTERMRITSTGDVYIGETSGGSGAGNVLKPKGYNTRTGHAGSFGSNSWNIWWTGSALQAYVDNNNVGTFTFASDYRVKKNIETIDSSCLERVKQLRPVRYELADYGNLFKADGIVREGFIAHEVQEVIPSGAEGNKDEENRIQNLRTDAIVAVLTKALQEAISKIETLEAKVAALESA